MVNMVTVLIPISRATTVKKENTLFDDFLNILKEFAENTSYIESVIIVGSYARGTNKANSDLDIIIITSNKTEMVENQDFIQKFGEIDKKQTDFLAIK